MCTIRFHLVRWGFVAFLLLGRLVHAQPAGNNTAQPAGKNTEPAERPSWTTSKIAGTPETPDPYRIVQVFPKLSFQKPTSIEELPSTKRLLVTEMSGRVSTIFRRENLPDEKTTQADVALDLTAALPEGQKKVSLFDAEPDPDFAKNGLLYLCYVHPGNGGHTRVSRFQMTVDSPPKCLPESELVLITWPAGGHNGGCLEFGKDGMLYISTGDGTGPNPPDGKTTGQDVSDLLGSVLRLDVREATTEKPYAIPADNPFVGKANSRAEIWAYGLRNPWKFGIDPEKGSIFVADNGWESWEMVHKLQRGGNCGWPVMEGRTALRSEVAVGPTPILPPVMDHPHTEANSVIGGPVYRGNKLPDLQGSFVYGDYITGTIWSIGADKTGNYSMRTLLDTDLQIVAFTQLSTGELLVLDYDFTGQIYELLPAKTKDRSSDFPRLLSQTGLFRKLKKLEPNNGVFPYEVTAPRWQDGAIAQRLIALPGTFSVDLSAGYDQPSQFPEGTVLVKHLSWPQGEKSAIPLETQLLHYEDGTWRPYSYLWDETGTDATLVNARGGQRVLQIQDPTLGKSVEKTWHVNAVNECKLCHNAGAGYVLGFTAQQLHRIPTVHDEKISQLDLLASVQVVHKPTELVPGTQLVNPLDSQQKLDDRARSYLHANCGMCHHPKGNAIVSFYLRRDLPFEKLNTFKGTGIGTFGMSDAKIIHPGLPFRSVLYYRMTKLGYARMPYIGSREVDSSGVSLMEEWIRSLKSDAPGLDAEGTLKKYHEATNPAETESALKELLKTTEGALALATDLHRGKVPQKQSALAIKTGASATAGDLRGLFDAFLPEKERRKTLGPAFDPQLVLQMKGSAERGRLIYFSDGSRCKHCHEAENREQSVGPTLKEINKKHPQLPDLLTHVIQPSQKIEEAFIAYLVQMKDGQILTGLLVNQTEKEVVLKTAEKKLHRLARAQIERIQPSKKSLMPDQLFSDFMAQEAADLLAYLQSVGAAP